MEKPTSNGTTKLRYCLFDSDTPADLCAGGGPRGIRTHPFRSVYAANLGMALSTNRKNRVLRAPATISNCDPPP
jgi:hypothetical protein